MEHLKFFEKDDKRLLQCQVHLKFVYSTKIWQIFFPQNVCKGMIIAGYKIDTVHLTT